MSQHFKPHNESRALVIIFAIGGYIGYRLFQKYVGCDNVPGRRQIGAVAHAFNQHVTPAVNTLLGNKEPKLILNDSLETQVGQNLQFRILFSSRRRGILGTLGGGGSGSATTNRAHIADLERSLGQLLNERTQIEIVKVIGYPDNIPVIREFEVDPETQNDILRVTFTARESGFYEVRVKYNGKVLRQSPFLVSFLSTHLDCDQTGLIRQSPTVLFSTEHPHSLLIEPKDKFGNLCRIEDIEIDKFSFQLYNVGDVLKDEPVGPFTYNFVPSSVDDWGQFKAVVRFELEIFQPGVYKGKISYNEKQIGSGSFDIITLSREEQVMFKEMLTKALAGSLYHPAQLLETSLETLKKPKTVYIYTASKLITVKEYFLGFIPSRIGTYRIHPALRIQLKFEDNGQSLFTISDRIQPDLTLEMDTTSFRLSLALFAHFLQERLGGSESFENKVKFFAQELQSARDDNKMRVFIGLRIERSNLVDSSIAATRNFGVKDWCKKFKIQFEGEEGSDDGGLRREWLNLLCCKLFENNPEGLFCSMGNSRLVHPNPNRSSGWASLKYYEFAGKIVAKCLYETYAAGGFYKQSVNGRFSRSFLAQIIGFPVQIKYFEADDPEFYLGKVKYLRENKIDVDSIDLTFTEEVYSKGVLIETVDLIPGGSSVRVTDANKEEYLNSVAQYRFGRKVHKEIEAFLKGLNEIIPDGLLTNFDENELEILMCGKSTFVTQDLKMNHVVSISDDHVRGELDKILPWFWSTIDNMTDEERGRLLQFTTGSSLLPRGGFKELQPNFRITLTHSFGKLPLAHTCFNEICLSMHKTYEEFQKSLLTAINEGSEGFGFM